MPRAAQLEFFGNAAYAKLFDASVQRLRDLGGEACEVDIEPLLETARLLYEGPWVAERYLATESLLTSQPDAMLEVTRQIISGGANPKALDAFRAQYRLKDLIRAGAADLGDRAMCCCCRRPALTTASPTSRPIPSGSTARWGATPTS